MNQKTSHISFPRQSFLQKKKEEKTKRLAQALRENLRKRKEQMRLRKDCSSLLHKENHELHSKS